MLSLERVTKEFRLDEHTTITPVHDVSLDVERGEFVIIIGRSGTGKSTLLNLAAGLVRPTSGKVTLDDKDLSRMSDKELSALRSSKVGFVFQFPSLLSSLSVKENVSLPVMFANGQGSRNGQERSARLLSSLGLAKKMDVYPRQLSAGEAKRVVIARSLVNNPEIILADEPTSDLDNRTEREVMGLLREINAQGVAFLIVTHSLELLPFATRAYEMEHGKLNRIAVGGAEQRIEAVASMV